MISKDKTYRTRDGREVRIYATDGGSGRQIHGAYKNDGWQLVPCGWDENGRHMTSQSLDLVEVKPRIKRTVWLNVYDSEGGVAFASKEAADFCSSNRLACVKVEIDCEEGEGL